METDGSPTTTHKCVPSNLYSWVETNIDWSKRKSGGASFILKSDIRYEQVMPDGEYISFIKNMDGMFE